MSEPSPDRIMQIASGFWASKALLSATGLGLFTELAKGPATAADLAGRLALHPRPAADLLDALVALGLLAREGDGPSGLYANTPETGRYLDRAGPAYVGGILELWDRRNFAFWADLTEALRTGEAQSEVKRSGTSFFEALYADPGRLEAFIDAMTAVSRTNFELLARRFPFGRYRTLCDVGGADALLSTLVAEAHPHLACTSLDLPMVMEIARRRIAGKGLADRVAAESVDFFAEPLPRADVVTMGMILHDWGLERKKLLVRKAYEALPEGGALVAIEALIDDARRERAFPLLLSLNMLVELGDAFEFTAADFRAWCGEAGFRSFEVIPLAGPSSAAVAYK